MLLLDYTDCLEDVWAISGGGERKPADEDLFFGKRGLCPFCSVSAPHVFGIPHTDTKDGFYHAADVWECPECGWWEVKTWQRDIASCEWSRLYHAILRQYNVNGMDVPLGTLRAYINRNTGLLYDLHPRKMEFLVQAVLQDFFECEVVHCGRSHDGGIDLVLVQSDAPMLIQVKRRASRTRVEPVGTVRELLGATLIAGGSSCAIVTTASHFSREAKESARTAISKGIVREFALFDARRFVEILDLAQKNEPRPWKVHLAYLLREG